MNYTIDEIEGIGPSYRAKLANANIATTEQLLATCGSREGRKHTADSTGVSESHLLKWTNMADLMRITGIGRQNAELLEASGVDTVKELKHRNAENLAEAVRAVNDEKRLAKSTPSAAAVQGWIDQAKSLDPAVSY